MTYPLLIEETWKLRLPQKHRLDDLTAELETPWMRFEKTADVRFNGRLVEVKFVYQTLAAEVAAQDLVEYAKAVEEVREFASFYVEDIPAEHLITASSELSDGANAFLRALAVGLLSFYLGAAVLLVLWRFYRRHQRLKQKSKIAQSYGKNERQRL